MSLPRQGLTRAQRAVLQLVEHGAAIWEVSQDDNDGGEYRVPPRYLLAVFDGDDLLYTQPVQTRTLLELRRRGLIEVELP